MKIFIKAKPASYEEKVEKIDGSHYLVCVTEPPQNGLANRGIVRVLAEYFKVSQSRVVIKKGFTGKNKIIEIV